MAVQSSIIGDKKPLDKGAADFAAWLNSIGAAMGNAFKTSATSGAGAGTGGMPIAPPIRPVTPAKTAGMGNAGLTGTRSPVVPAALRSRGALPIVADRVTNDYRAVGSMGQPNTVPTDWLQLAQDTLTGVDYSGVMNDYKSIAAKARARIGAMYKALQGERQAAEAIYGGYRDAANQSIGASADQAASDIAAGYQNATSQQAAEMAALGLADTLAQSAAQNTAEDQGYNVARSAQTGSSFKNANELGRAADLAYNQGMIGAAGFASNEGKAQIDQQLSQALAQLSMAQEQANAQLPLQQLQYANGLYNLWQSQQPASMSIAQELQAQQDVADKALSDQKFRKEVFDMFYQQTNDAEEARRLTEIYFS